MNMDSTPTIEEARLMGDGHLCNLYHKWRAKPEQYSEEMAQTVNKVMHTVFRKRQVSSAYRNFEEYFDLQQELRKLCFESVLPNIKPPITNRRIYNYLYTSILRRLQNLKKRAVTKNMKENEAAVSDRSRFLQDQVVEIENFPTFGCQLTDQVAHMLGQGHTKTEIKRSLELNNHQLKRCLDTIRQHYAEGM
jgi:hypothetical protein